MRSTPALALRLPTFGIFMTTLLSGALLLLPAPQPAHGQEVVVVEVDVKAVAAGTRASKLIGEEVLNADGESIGDIDDLIIDQKSVLFAILQVGGFLGLGGLLVAVPYDRLEIGGDDEPIVLAEASREQLERMPEFKYEP
jgi:sporulation protein YlmC with PRC-barrel domain